MILSNNIQLTWSKIIEEYSRHINNYDLNLNPTATDADISCVEL